MTSIRPSTYDSRRRLVAPKPLLRGWSHLIAFEVSLVLGTLLLTSVPAGQRWAAATYAVALSGLFGTSALYHRGVWNPRAHALLQRIDHAMIFVLIAGTATPVVAVCLPGVAAELLTGLWALTLAALGVHLARMNAPEVVVGGTYVMFGLLGAVALPAVWTTAGPTAFVLLLGGGVLYIVGAVLYHRRRPDPWPRIFGFHEVFHAFVCAAAALHYVAIAHFLL